MKVCIIGYGNLGSSLAEGLIKSGAAAPGDIAVCDASSDALARAKTLGAVTTDNVNYAITGSDTVFFTVKSYVFEKLVQDIDRDLLGGKTVVSFMAGVQFERIYELLGNVTLVRAMPSLAIATCDGVIGYTKASADVEAVFRGLGYAFETAPEDIEKVMAFSSCGLGFAAYLMDAFAAAGEELGFSPDTCAEIAARTFKNAAERGDYKSTVKAVATPGGATEQGVLYMDDRSVYDIVTRAVKKAYDRMT